MNREEYMRQLKALLQSLTLDEQNEALQYYEDYFDEAGDDQKVIEELGSPETLAESISQKLANAVAKKDFSGGKDNKKDDESNESGENGGGNFHSSYESDALYFSFDKEKVKSVDFSFGALEVVIISGDEFFIETRALDKNSFDCHLSKNGVLVAKNVRRLNLDFWNHEKRRRVVPRLLVCIPKDFSFEHFRLSLGAGKVTMKDAFFSCFAYECDVGAGSIFCGEISSHKASLRCGMGYLEFYGSLLGRTNIDCMMGAMKVILKGNVNDYSYDLKLGLGDFKFNDEKKAGACQVASDEQKENHLSVNCGIGSVRISIG